MESKQITTKQLRTFGIALAIFLSIIAVIRFVHQGQQTALILWTSAGVVFLLTLLSPALIKPVYRGAMFIAGILGWINTRILLAIFFYLILTPISLVLKIFHKDPLKRKLGPEAETYWEPHSEKAADKNRYFHQF
ncbi:MAG: hypothetical protein GXO74_10635 [Calditrichaeota bacterium]|nr:hypothetical protein [Calditrichota bacterium]